MRLRTLLLRFSLTLLALYVAGGVLEGFSVNGPPSLLLMAAVVTVMGAVVAPILIALTLPLTVLTLGLFLFVLNALLFWAASLLVPGVTVDGFFTALLASLIVTLFRFIGQWKKI